MGERLSRREFVKGAGMGAAALAGGFAFAARAGAHQGDPGAGAHGGYPDALHHKVLSDLKEAAAWAGTAKLYIGEVGVASNLGRRYPENGAEVAAHDEAEWGAILDAWYAYADAKSMWVTAQVVSEAYYAFPNRGYFASIHLSPEGAERKCVSRPAPSGHAAVVERHPQASGRRRGYNFHVGQKWDKSVHSNDNPGVYGGDYWYPTLGDEANDAMNRDPNTGWNSFQYLKSRANGAAPLVRIGFRWERVQRAIGGALDATEVGRLKKVVANAKAAGLQVVLDLHNYGQYYAASGKKSLGSASLPGSALSDVWDRLSSHFKDEPTVVAYDIMNEPFNDGGIDGAGYPTEWEKWEVITQRVVNTIRQNGDNTPIMVPTYCGVDGIHEIYKGGGVPNPQTHAGGPWIVQNTATTGPILYTMHHYFDHYFGDGTGGGQYDLSYQDEDSYWDTWATSPSADY